MSKEYLTIEDHSTAAAAETIPDEIVLQTALERPAVFGMLVERYQAPFLRLAERVVRNRAEAEDVVQDAFVKIYRYGRRFRKGEDRKFSSWAYKIVLNTAITHYHKVRKREWQLPEDTDPTIEQSHANFRRAALDRETEAIVGSVLGVMPEELARLLGAYYLKDKPYKIIAADEGISLGALKMKLFRARKLFRRFLTP